MHIVGFLSGALTAPFIGTLADHHGRRTACLAFCLASAASCFLTAWPAVISSFPGSTTHHSLIVPALFAGRILGGLATSLLFTVFESWMVADFRARGLDAQGQGGGDLSRSFGLMATVNSMVAITSGLAAEWLVAATGSLKAPFGASIGLVAVAAIMIRSTWVRLFSSLLFQLTLFTEYNFKT